MTSQIIHILLLKFFFSSPGWAPQLVRASSGCAKVAGLIPGDGTYENQLINQ